MRLGGELLINHYDGKSLGSFNPDTVAISSGSIMIYGMSIGSGSMFIQNYGPFSYELLQNNVSDAQIATVIGNPSRFQRINFSVGRSGNETAGAWIAVTKYIVY